MKIDQYTELYGIVGLPVKHSLSPVMHNAAFQAVNKNAVYLAFETGDLKGVINGMRALSINGMSVTIPHKVNIISYLDELHPLAKDIGAVNTIVNCKGRLIGYNTDATGALRALEERISLEGIRCLILGAGGAARSIGFALKGVGAILTITNRTASRGQALSEALSCTFVPWERIDNIDTELIVQATPVGMAPEVDACPIPESVLKPGLMVMDIVYNPYRTKLLKLAMSKGCDVIDGVSMFVYQGAEQFRLWTKMDPPISVMERAVKEALGRHHDSNRPGQKSQGKD
ncbi:MAG: shikimate dehydrogenase [Deltaproteobacteria bacterium]|nr:MAG: shikimate dehydrogenase [Deltaproteobacteria bacterium]